MDSETTGLDSVRNDIIQFACIPVIAGQRMSSFNQHCQPINWNNIDDAALKINNISRSSLPSFQKPEIMVDNLIRYLRAFNVKFTIAGFNVGFDKDFLASLFKKVNREHEYIELFTQDIRDTFKRAKKLKAQLPTQNLKLQTLCNHFKIDINAHDALSDISATIELDSILANMLGETEIFIIEQHKEYDFKFQEPAQLHVHSMYSYTDSINSIKDWAKWCSLNKVPAFSTVDHGTATALFDIVNVKALLKKANDEVLKNNKKFSTNDPLYDNPVIGVPGSGLFVNHNNQMFYLNAWAQTNTGYKNLIKLSSVGWKNRVTISNAEFPLLSLDEVQSLKEGLIFGVPGVNGPITNLLLSRQIQGAKEFINELHTKLPIVLELAAIDVYKRFDSDIGFVGYDIDGGNIQKHINMLYLNLSKELGIKCIPVSDAHMISEQDKLVQDCICKNSFKDHRYFFESRHACKAKDMFSVLKSHLGDELTESSFNDMIQTTIDIAKPAAEITVKHEYHLPVIEIPENIKQRTHDYNMQTYYYMMQKIKEHGRWNDSKEYVDRFKKEVDVIMKNSTLNFIPYFLVYEDVCSYARSSGLMQGIARGSAGGSLLSYYLQIIHVDPVKANLPFERFLSHARIRAGSFPDIDLDIADRARPLVMKYLKDKYNLGFAQIATFNKMKTKNAIKDAMYALYGRNRNDEEVKAVCDQIDDSPQGVDEHDFLYGYEDQEGEEHLGEVDKKPILKNFFQQKPEVEEMVKKLLGSIRGFSRHASAFVISTIDLAADRVPTMIMSDKDLGEITVTQFDAPMVEKSGLVKADILGIKTLSVISDAVKKIKENYSIDFMEKESGVPLIYRLPDRDKGVFSDFYKSDTDSSFQFNSDVIKAAAKEFAPLCREDLALMTALYRPGAMDAKIDVPTIDGDVESIIATNFYVQARNRQRDAYYIHEDLKEYVEETLGVIVFQEQVMAILVGLCGYTLEETDIIRSAIAKKKHEVMMAAFERIRVETAKRGWSKEQSNTLCDTIMAFSRYSFNRSHSWAYAETGYITLYLKHHYPLEWWSSVLNNEDKEDKTRKYVSYLGDKLAPPSLKNPSNEFVILNGKIVTPISSIKSVGPTVVKEIVSKGPFSSLEEYMEKIDHSRVNIGGISALIKSRAADDLMDYSIEDYIERRRVFMTKYLSLRKSRTEFKPEMWDLNPISIFLQEKEYNLAFNKTLLSSPSIREVLKSKWPGLRETNSKVAPLSMGSDNETLILNGIKSAEIFLNKGVDQEVGMILLFDSSNYKSGISKKGKPWHRVSVLLSDGFNVLEATVWDAKKAFGWQKDTLVYVRGQLKKGFRTAVSLNVEEIQKVE